MVYVVHPGLVGQDASWTCVEAVIWSVVEANIAIVCGKTCYELFYLTRVANSASACSMSPFL